MSLQTNSNTFFSNSSVNRNND